MKGLVWALLLAAANPAQPAKKPAPAPSIAATGPLSRTDLVAIARLGLTASPDPFKDHPSARFGARAFELVGRLHQKGEGGEATDGEWTYDRDAKVLVATYRNFGELTFFDVSQPAGSYIGQNAFGVKAEVKRFKDTTFLLKSTREDSPVLRVEIPADPETAKRLTETLRVRIVGQLIATKGTVTTCESSSGEPTLVRPYQVALTSCALKAWIDRVTIEGGGTVQASWTYEDDVAGRYDKLKRDGPNRAVLSVIKNPAWAKEPTGDDIARYFPDRAQRMEVAGRAVIACMVTAKLTLDGCTVVSETPEAYGFGDAALNLSRFYRMKPTTLDGVAVSGGQTEISIAFPLPK